MAQDLKRAEEDAVTFSRAQEHSAAFGGDPLHPGVPHRGTDTTILLVEDHPIVRLGLRTVLETQPDMRIVGESATESHAFDTVRATKPDLVILPLRLGGELRGVELCREIKSGPNAPHVLIYTSFNSREDASSAYLSGADSFLHKGEQTSRLLDTIRAIASGRRVWILGPESSESSEQLRNLERRLENSRITSREREILGFMLQRFTNAEIANELFIEIPTVKTHVSSILQKLGIRRLQDLF
ncbi:response regulator transcription factor [Arthrobacter sp. CG_A4]|uniref:response regulator transcription factor n=1 Tax=Arthrobacter sp. CG_A4 TaxID=3071706 RepID=UPI002E01518D|nr:DNA-binding NarL/FixJ family response regulator [Arthrobacter sp. CG_A4]